LTSISTQDCWRSDNMDEKIELEMTPEMAAEMTNGREEGEEDE
jgi:hypothetical protein